MADSGGRSRSKRLISSAAKCCESAAEPPLPHARIFPSLFRHCTMRSAAAAIGPANASIDCSLRCADSEKFSLMRVMRSNLTSFCVMPAIVPTRALIHQTSFTKRVRQPLDPPLVPMEQHHVEAAGAGGTVRREVVPRRGDEAPPFGRGDAGAGPAEFVRAPGAHLDEHQHRVAGGNEVDFTETAAVIALEDLQTLALKEGGGEALVGT